MTKSRRKPSHPPRGRESLQTADPVPEKRNQRFLAYLPVMLLLLVALTQFGRAKLLGQTSWKGGGFGMFASLDHARFARVFLLKGQQAVPFLHTGELAFDRDKAVALPSDANIQRFASRVASFAVNDTAYYAEFHRDNRVGVMVVVYGVGLVGDKTSMQANEILRYELPE